jgi:glycosyltransferase involved in cell wall biosynthesis
LQRLIACTGASRTENPAAERNVKKVCFVLNNFVGTGFEGGGGKVSYRLINMFSLNRHSVDIVCGSTTETSYPGINRIVVINRPYGKTPSELEAFFADVNKRISIEGYDAVISDNITPHADISLVQYHSEEHRLQLHGATAVLRRLSKIDRIRKQNEWARQSPRRVIAVSQSIKNDLVKNLRIPPEKIGVVYPGVAVDDVANEHDPAGRVSGKIFTFGFVATGFSTKGGYIFLQALRRLARQGHHFKARIVYPEYEKRRLMRMLVRYYGLEPYTEFIPYQKNVKGYYASLNCLVMPSVHEAFGLVALEAMANKLPCIVSSVSGVSELIQDGINGLVFDMTGRSDVNLAARMSFVLENGEQGRQIGQKGYETALRYNWNKTYADFVKEINL